MNFFFTDKNLKNLAKSYFQMDSNNFMKEFKVEDSDNVKLKRDEIIYNEDDFSLSEIQKFVARGGHIYYHYDPQYDENSRPSSPDNLKRND